MNASRLIYSGPCDTAANMAIDEALLNTYEETLSKPVLRIYGWRNPSFSYGYSQNPDELFHLDLCREKKVPVVRRPTGGGIIFHNDELTYCIILAQSDLGIKLNVKETLKHITSFLFLAYQSLRKKASFAIEAEREMKQPHAIADFCFSRNEDYDIMIDGKKIGGNAQKRKKRLIMQHGSIPFSFKKEEIKPFLKNGRFLENLHVTCIDEITKEKISFAALSNILQDAFCAHFSTTLEQSELTKNEKALAQKLKREKYANPQWNLFRK